MPQIAVAEKIKSLLIDICSFLLEKLMKRQCSALAGLLFFQVW